MTQFVLTADDFNRVLDDYAGRQLILEKNTPATSNLTGEQTDNVGQSDSIKAYFMRTNQNWNYEKEGFTEQGDAVALIKFSDGATKHDYIYTDPKNTFSINSIDGNATTISIETSSSHGVSVNDKIIILGTTNYDGAYTVASVPTSTTLTISDTNHDLAAETSGIIGTNIAKFEIMESFNVPGTFDSSGGGTVYVYTACNLFLKKNET